jgi:hypothetical protein
MTATHEDDDKDPETDPQYSAAFKAMHAAAEAVRAAGVSGPDVWALLFGVLQDQQAADLGMGSEAHRDEMQAQRDSLSNSLDGMEVLPVLGRA